jgi:hypothetical protein
MYSQIEQTKFLKMYKAQKSNARTRGISFMLTFEQWMAIWTESGKLHLRGRGAEKFCMCRNNDVGSYEVGNVFIGTGRENVKAGNLGKLDSDETRKKKSQSMRGLSHPWSVGEKNPMHRPEVKAKISAKISGANHYKQRGVNTPQGYFVTAKAASIALSIPKPTVEWRARYNKFGFSLPELA